MYYKKIKFLSWNCRGLGLVEKCGVVSDMIRTSRCDVVLLQETKLNEVISNYVLRFLPSFSNLNCAYNQAHGTKGGLIIAWKRSFELIDSYSTPHSISVRLKHVKSDQELLVTNVYRLSTDNEKPRFIDELTFISNLICHPWIIGGDFNLVRWMIDRSGDLRGFELMDLFNDFVRDAGLVDVPLRN